jgi:hypothetical protein
MLMEPNLFEAIKKIQQSTRCFDVISLFTVPLNLLEIMHEVVIVE